MTTLFQLHPRLQQDCITLGKFDLCQLLMMNDSQYPWFMLTEESNYLAKNLATLFSADKMNIAAIGNLVPQLHLHHVVRYQTDRAWPAPVWGKFDSIPYTDEQLIATLTRVKAQLTSLND